MRSAWLIATSFALVYLALARFAFEAFPISGDEHSYLLQGQIFARGHLSIPAPHDAQLFQVDHVLIDHTVRSKYPLGWPALLAVGWLVNAPWIVNPILAALTLAVTCAIGSELHGERAGLVAMALLACAPIFALNAASYFSHVSALCAGALYVFGLVRATVSKTAQWAAIGGLGLGAMFLIRPSDALSYSLAALALHRSPRILLACAIPAALVAALTLPYQAAQFGSPWRSGYVAYDPVYRAMFGYSDPTLPTARFLFDPSTQWWHLGSFFELASWLVPGTMLLGFIHWMVTAKRGSVHRFFILLGAIPSLAILPLPDIATGDSYGPRHLFPVLLPLAVGAGAAWPRLENWLAGHPSVAAIPAARVTRWSLLALATFLVGGIIRCGIFTEREHVKIERRSRLYRQVKSLGLDRAVVIVADERPSFWARNLADFDGPVLYVSAWARTDQEVARLFPDRDAYAARRSPGAFDWTIARVPSAE